MKNLFILMVLCSLLPFGSIEAQNQSISGRIVVYDSIPVAGALIKVKNTKQSVRSDAQGYFQVEIEGNDRLTISAKGFYASKINTEEESNFDRINLILKPGERNLDMVIQNGYVVDNERFRNARSLESNGSNFGQFASFFDLIEGRFPNVVIRQDEILIRGPKSLSAYNENIGTSNSALIVLDGVPTNFSVLSTLIPKDLKRVEIITGSQAMRYGPDAGNGVLLIETKGFEN